MYEKDRLNFRRGSPKTSFKLADHDDHPKLLFGRKADDLFRWMQNGIYFCEQFNTANKGGNRKT
jgi:hypothetical protein